MARPRNELPPPEKKTGAGRPVQLPRLGSLDIEAMALGAAAEAVKHFNDLVRQLKPLVELLPRPSPEELASTRVAQSWCEAWGALANLERESLPTEKQHIVELQLGPWAGPLGSPTTGKSHLGCCFPPFWRACPWLQGALRRRLA